MVLGLPFGRRQKRQEEIDAEVRFWKSQLDAAVDEKNYYLGKYAEARRQSQVLQANTSLLHHQLHVCQQQMLRMSEQQQQRQSLEEWDSGSAQSGGAASSVASAHLVTANSPVRVSPSDSVKMMEIQLSSCQGRLRETEMNLSKAEDRIAILTRELSSARAEVRCAQSTADAYKAEAEMLRTQLALARGVGDDTAETAAWLAQQLQAAQSETHKLRVDATMKGEMLDLLKAHLSEAQLGVPSCDASLIAPPLDVCDTTSDAPDCGTDPMYTLISRRSSLASAHHYSPSTAPPSPLHTAQSQPRSTLVTCSQGPILQQQGSASDPPAAGNDLCAVVRRERDQAGLNGENAGARGRRHSTGSSCDGRDQGPGSTGSVTSQGRAAPRTPTKGSDGGAAALQHRTLRSPLRAPLPLPPQQGTLPPRPGQSGTDGGSQHAEHGPVPGRATSSDQLRAPDSPDDFNVTSIIARFQRAGSGKALLPVQPWEKGGAGPVKPAGHPVVRPGPNSSVVPLTAMSGEAAVARSPARATQ